VFFVLVVFVCVSDNHRLYPDDRLMNSCVHACARDDVFFLPRRFFFFEKVPEKRSSFGHDVSYKGVHERRIQVCVCVCVYACTYVAYCTSNNNNVIGSVSGSSPSYQAHGTVSSPYNGRYIRHVKS